MTLLWAPWHSISPPCHLAHDWLLPSSVFDVSSLPWAGCYLSSGCISSARSHSRVSSLMTEKKKKKKGKGHLRHIFQLGLLVTNLRSWNLKNIVSTHLCSLWNPKHCVCLYCNCGVCLFDWTKHQMAFFLSAKWL